MSTRENIRLIVGAPFNYCIRWLDLYNYVYILNESSKAYSKQFTTKA